MGSDPITDFFRCDCIRSRNKYTFLIKKGSGFTGKLLFLENSYENIDEI